MARKKYWHILLLLFSFCFGCKQSEGTAKHQQLVQIDSTGTNLQEENFDTIIGKKKVNLFWLKNDGIKAAFTNYGGRIIGLWVPDSTGTIRDVVAGMKSVGAYARATEPYFGALIGRVANRINKGEFSLNGKRYDIPKNNQGNTLHGGNKGFQDVVWDARQPDDTTLVFQYFSPAMEEGFPGDLKVEVTYSLTHDRRLKINYEAVTGAPTPVNLTNHAFFNLNGEGSGSILKHKLKLNADHYTPVDKRLIPTGKIEPVKDTPFDFRTSHSIGERIAKEHEQLNNGDGYDHNFVLNKNSEGLIKAATVTGDKSGIVMEVYTTEPGIQFYSGNFMQGENTFKSGGRDEYRSAFALETQHFPDAVNQKSFPSIILEPTQTYRTISEYHFSTTNNHIIKP